MEEQNNEMGNPDLMLELTAEVVSAYVSNNPVASGDLGNLIGDVHRALSEITGAVGEPAAPEQEPAVNPKKSVFRDYIICLEDGKKFKSLKRHLRSHFDMSPEEYREKWSLPQNYPMVAPAYSERRSALAKEKGLGRKRGSRA